MLGKELSKIFLDAIKFTRSELDIADENSVRLTIEKIKPDVVVNEAAYTNFDRCEDDQELAFNVNGRSLEYIALRCSSVGATLVHLESQ
jgi:dTDP-4-dehydrorhamnose reductase